MEQRTEDQIVAQSPITVILGGKEYEVKLLNIREAPEWRKQVIKLIAPLPGLVGISSDNEEEFGKALTSLLCGLPDQVADLFFAYAKDLPREEIAEEANEFELKAAFEGVMKIGFPLAEVAPDVMARIFPKAPTQKRRSR